MAIEVKDFGTSREGKKVYLYSLTNSKGMKAEFMNVGAILVNLFVPKSDGTLDDVVLGFDSVDAYYGNISFFGALIGPSANRIAEAYYELDDVGYCLDINDNENNLHSHFDLGYHKRYFEAETDEKKNAVTFSLEDPGTLGFPGNKRISVTYTLTEENELVLHYHGSSDELTIINLTNHTYFNLDGHASGKILDHTLTIEADTYTPGDEGSIPYGDIVPVEGTPMDFTKATRVGDRIDEDFEQLVFAKGYDHNYCIRGWEDNNTLRPAATLSSEKSGRTMKVFTTLPGMQFYAGNCIKPQDGKDGVKYKKRDGLCLETQYYPDNIHHDNFPAGVFGGDSADSRDYDSTTVYAFSW